MKFMTFEQWFATLDDEFKRTDKEDLVGIFLEFVLCWINVTKKEEASEK
jgi:hypothetical protein